MSSGTLATTKRNSLLVRTPLSRSADSRGDAGAEKASPPDLPLKKRNRKTPAYNASLECPEGKDFWNN
jgi:hypothetical protein